MNISKQTWVVKLIGYGSGPSDFYHKIFLIWYFQIILDYKCCKLLVWFVIFSVFAKLKKPKFLHQGYSLSVELCLNFELCPVCYIFINYLLCFFNEIIASMNHDIKNVLFKFLK